MINSTLELELEISTADLMDHYRYECEKVNNIEYDAEEFLVIHYDLFPYHSFIVLLKEYLAVIVEALHDANGDELSAEDQFYQIFEDNFEGDFLGAEYNVSVDGIMVYIENLVQHIYGLGVEEIYDYDLTHIRRIGDVYSLTFNH